MVIWNKCMHISCIPCTFVMLYNTHQHYNSNMHKV